MYNYVSKTETLRHASIPSFRVENYLKPNTCSKYRKLKGRYLVYDKIIKLCWLISVCVTQQLLF